MPSAVQKQKTKQDLNNCALEGIEKGIPEANGVARFLFSVFKKTQVYN